MQQQKQKEKEKEKQTMMMMMMNSEAVPVGRGLPGGGYLVAIVAIVAPLVVVAVAELSKM